MRKAKGGRRLEGGGWREEGGRREGGKVREDREKSNKVTKDGTRSRSVWIEARVNFKVNETHP